MTHCSRESSYLRFSYRCVCFQCVSEIGMQCASLSALRLASGIMRHGYHMTISRYTSIPVSSRGCSEPRQTRFVHRNSRLRTNYRNSLSHGSRVARSDPRLSPSLDPMQNQQFVTLSMNHWPRRKALETTHETCRCIIHSRDSVSCFIFVVQRISWTPLNLTTQFL